MAGHICILYQQVLARATPVRTRVCAATVDWGLAQQVLGVSFWLLMFLRIIVPGIL